MTIHLPETDKIKVVNSKGVFKVMNEILLREDDIDRYREHFWVVSLSNNNQIMNIELISLGSMNKAIVEPTEVFSFALQKHAAKIILVHNHPSGELTPSADDLDITDRLIQVGEIVNCPVIDHLIITTKEYISFVDIGLFTKLQKSSKYVLVHSDTVEKRGEQNKAKETARKMIQKQKYELEEIKEMTGLTLKQLEKLMKELLHKTK